VLPPEVQDINPTMSPNIPEWKHKAALKREAQFDSIPPEWRLPELKSTPKNTYEYLKTSGILTARELEITETTSAPALLSQLASGTLSAVDVTTAFCKRAALSHQLIKCCTEMFFTEALETARRLDQYLAENGKPIGPLHGLPISMKDNFQIKGQDTTIGWVSEIGKPATESDLLVRCLEKQGAVMYVKTNIPQSLMVRSKPLPSQPLE
jgi:amidase